MHNHHRKSRSHYPHEISSKFIHNNQNASSRRHSMRPFPSSYKKVRCPYFQIDVKVTHRRVQNKEQLLRIKKHQKIASLETNINQVRITRSLSDKVTETYSNSIHTNSSNQQKKLCLSNVSLQKATISL